MSVRFWRSAGHFGASYLHCLCISREICIYLYRPSTDGLEPYTKKPASSSVHETTTGTIAPSSTEMATSSSTTTIEDLTVDPTTDTIAMSSSSTEITAKIGDSTLNHITDKIATSSIVVTTASSSGVALNTTASELKCKTLGGIHMQVSLASRSHAFSGEEKAWGIAYT